MRLFRLTLGFALFCAALVLAAVPALQPGIGSAYAEAVAVVAVSSDAPGLCCAGEADQGAPAGSNCGHISCSSPVCDFADTRAGGLRSFFRRAPLDVASWQTLALAPDPRPPRPIGQIV